VDLIWYIGGKGKDTPLVETGIGGKGKGLLFWWKRVTQDLQCLRKSILFLVQLKN